jgi:hypothetical protein
MVSILAGGVKRAQAQLPRLQAQIRLTVEVEIQYNDALIKIPLLERFTAC